MYGIIIFPSIVFVLWRYSIPTSMQLLESSPLTWIESARSPVKTQQFLYTIIRNLFDKQRGRMEHSVLTKQLFAEKKNTGKM
jgi:hypothetical protein